jgi:predicted Zn-dependent protease
LLGALLGIGVAIATGEGGAGAAVTAGSQSMAARRFFSHSRIQESSADQAALSFLKEAGISSEGLLSFLSKLEDQDILPQSQQSEYIRTHPLSRNRIDALKRHADSVPGTRDPYPRQWDSEHARMKAKLMGFLRPQQVIWYYDENENSVSSLYAHAIAAYRQSKIKKSLNLVNKLLAKEPKNPYFLELKAQMLKDYGNLKEAIIFYEKALDNIERAPLIEIDLAHSLIESSAGNKKVLKKAVSLLKKAETRETRSTRIHRLLATAYGRMGLETKATLQLAEEALLQGKIDYARNLASRTKNHLEPGTKEYLRAVDILNFIENEESD